MTGNKRHLEMFDDEKNCLWYCLEGEWSTVACIRQKVQRCFEGVTYDLEACNVGTGLIEYSSSECSYDVCTGGRQEGVHHVHLTSGQSRHLGPR
jgi:hypothetical protein